MKPITLILFLAFSTPLFAQNDTLIVNNDYKFKIGVKGIVEETSYMVVVHKNYNIGVQLIYKLINSNFSSIETGIYYYNRHHMALAKDPYLSANGLYPYYEAKAYSTRLHIPLQYRLNTKMVYFGIGAIGEYQINTIVDSKKKNINKNKFEMGYIITAGFDKEILSNSSIFFELRYSSIVQNNYLREHENIGIGLGLNIKL